MPEVKELGRFNIDVDCGDYSRDACTVRIRSESSDGICEIIVDYREDKYGFHISSKVIGDEGCEKSLGEIARSLSKTINW